MSFIGIVCESKYESQIKQVLGRQLKNMNIIVLKEENIENFKNITFETIAIFSNHKVILNKKEILKVMIKKAKYLIMNSDEEINLNLMNQLDLKVISYGFNTKSTVTASSVNKDNILICIQRTIKGKDNLDIEPQEILVDNKSENNNSNIIIGLTAILVIYGVREIKI